MSRMQIELRSRQPYLRWSHFHNMREDGAQNSKKANLYWILYTISDLVDSLNQIIRSCKFFTAFWKAPRKYGVHLSLHDGIAKKRILCALLSSQNIWEKNSWGEKSKTVHRTISQPTTKPRSFDFHWPFFFNIRTFVCGTSKFMWRVRKNDSTTCGNTV